MIIILFKGYLNTRFLLSKQVKSFPYFLGLKQVKRKGYHILTEQNGKIYVGRGRTERGHAAGKLRGRKSTLGTGKKIPAYKNTSFRPNDENEIIQNELLVKELALSSDIGGVKRYSLKTKIKKHDIPNRKHLAQKTKMNVITKSPISHTISKKRTSIAFPPSTSGTSLPEKDAPMSRTLLTAIGLLLDERNHFEKDSNALSLAKVLLNIDKYASKKQVTHGSDSLNIASSLGGLSNILRLLNASGSQESPGGERKSTIHTELINPTELGISILRLLFGHQAPLVMKEAYKPALRYNPTTTILPVANPIFSPLRLASQMDEFAKGKSIPRKKRHKKTFTFALAKAVSDLIKSMAKQELKNYLQKIHNQPKFFKQTQSLRIPNRFWPSRKKVDVQGNRKSWVLLKIPRARDEAVPQQAMNDEPVEEKQRNEEKTSSGIVDTLGKLNEADPLTLETIDNNIERPSMSGANSEIKLRPTTRVGYKVRILPSLKASVGKQTDSFRVSEKPVKSPQLSPQTTAAFTEAVKKLLHAVQSSIKSLQNKQMIGHSSNVPSIVNDQPPKVNQRNLASIVSDRPPRVSEMTNTGSVRGMSSAPTPINAFQQDKIQPFLEDIRVSKQPSIGELSTFTRAAEQNELPVHGNDLFDPSKDLELAASEPITKTISPTKRLSPTDNVLFESATELGTTRDKQELSTVKHIKEGTFT